MADKEIHVKQVLKRFPPGDRWTPVEAEEPVFSSLTEGIEWVFQNTQERDYLIKAAEGKVYIYNEEEKWQTWDIKDCKNNLPKSSPYKTNKS